MATGLVEDEFYETTIRPNLHKLTTTLRVEIIQQRLQQENLITENDNQALRLAHMTPIKRAQYLLDLLKRWDAVSNMKFCQIIQESATNCPAHRTVAQLLKLQPDSEFRGMKEGK